MNIFFSFTKWNNFLSANTNTFLIVVTILSIITFIISFIMFEISSDEKNESLIGSFLISLGVSIVSWIIYLMIGAIASFVVCIILLFGLCFIAHKIINYIKNKPEKTYKIKNKNIDNIVESVYNEVSKINPNISYETIKDSVIKNIKE